LARTVVGGCPAAAGVAAAEISLSHLPTATDIVNMVIGASVTAAVGANFIDIRSAAIRMSAVRLAADSVVTTKLVVWIVPVFTAAARVVISFSLDAA